MQNVSPLLSGKITRSKGLMAYQRRTRLTVGDRVKGCQAVLFGQGPNGFLAAKDAAINLKDLEGKDRETGAKFVVKDTFSVVQKQFLW